MAIIMTRLAINVRLIIEASTVSRLTTNCAPSFSSDFARSHALRGVAVYLAGYVFWQPAYQQRGCSVHDHDQDQCFIDANKLDRQRPQNDQTNHLRQRQGQIEQRIGCQQVLAFHQERDRRGFCRVEELADRRHNKGDDVD